VIRPATSGDVSSIGTLIDAAYGGYVAALGRHPQPMDDDYALLVGRGEVTVLDVGNSLAGILVLQPVDNALLVRTVAIAPGYQRSGLGMMLMAHAEAQATASGKSTLRLYTNEVMAGNVDFYQRLGYSETHRAGPDGRQVVYMMKVLHG
jgi:GNAT superfamily N-acetyltransferase